MAKGKQFTRYHIQRGTAGIFNGHSLMFYRPAYPADFKPDDRKIADARMALHYCRKKYPKHQFRGAKRVVRVVILDD